MSLPSEFFNFTNFSDPASDFVDGSFIRTPGAAVRDFFTLTIDETSSYTGSILVQEQSLDVSSGQLVTSSEILPAGSIESFPITVQTTNSYRVKPHTDFVGTVKGVLHSGAHS